MITRHPNSNGPVTIADGTELKLRCDATGNGALTYEWKRVPGSLPKTARFRMNRQFLIIRRVTIIDAGQYYCVVSDNNGSVSSMRVQVTVKCKLMNHKLHYVKLHVCMHTGPPSITNTPSGQESSIVSGDEYVKLTCTVFGDDINGYWERVNNESLPTQNNMSSLSRDSTVVTLLSLNITRARPMHSGRYRCIAYSEVGTAQSEVVTVTIKSERAQILVLVITYVV